MSTDKFITADITFPQSHYSDLGRLSVTPVNALKEFIDNSTTSFYDNQERLKELGCSKCSVHVTWDDEYMIIKDNAFGMNEEQMRRALKPGVPPHTISQYSRSQYGLGLKYAAITMGNVYEITTQTPDSKVSYYSVMDVKKISEQDLKSNPIRVEDVADTTKHYTTIKISDLNNKFSEYNYGSKNNEKLNSIIEQLSVIYHHDIKNGKLELVINTIKVPPFNPNLEINKDSGTDRVNRFDDEFVHEGKTYKYSGWISYLKVGSTKTDSVTGLSLIQRDRAIMTFYKPTNLFGSGNNRALQRVVGEVFLEGDTWGVSFTKNQINWSKSLEEAFINSLKNNKEISEIIKESRKKNESTPTTTDKVKGWGLGDEKKEKIEDTKSKEKDKENTNANIKYNSGAKPKPSNINNNNEFAEETIYCDDEEYVLLIRPAKTDEIVNKAFAFKEVEKNKYSLIVNENYGKLSKMNSDKEKKVYYTLLTRLFIAEISARQEGVKFDLSEKINNKLNKLLN